MIEDWLLWLLDAIEADVEYAVPLSRDLVFIHTAYLNLRLIFPEDVFDLGPRSKGSKVI